MRHVVIATGITAIGLAVAAAAAFPSTDASTARRHVRCELGSLPTATAVTISPDGRAVAYEIDRTIEIRRLNGRLARVLNRDQGPVTIAQIAWSPDTEYLAVVEESSYGASLVVWNAMHGSLPVTFRSVDGFGGWTPDNQLFFRQRYGPNSFVLLDPRSARETRVGAFGSLSPDGRRVAHWEADGLAVETIFGTDRRLIASGTAQATQVTWSPDGTRLAWGEVPTGHLRIIRDNGADQRVVIPFVRDADAARVSPPYWTPAGIYFSATRQLGRPSLAFLADPGTGEVKRVGAVAPTPGSGSSIASVSGDGQLVVYALETPSDGTIGYRLVDRTTRADRQLFPCRGTSGRDVIRGSRLPDTILAGSGNDVVDVRSGAADIVSCGPGRDSVIADRFDRIGRDCERRD